MGCMGIGMWLDGSKFNQGRVASSGVLMQWLREDYNGQGAEL